MLGTPSKRALCAASVFVCGGLVAADTAGASTVLPISITVESDGGDLGYSSETGRANAIDDDPSTGYVVCSTPLNPDNNPNGSSQLLGFTIALAFDISGFSSTSGFDFALDGILEGPSSFDQKRVGASAGSNFIRVDAPKAS